MASQNSLRGDPNTRRMSTRVDKGPRQRYSQRLEAISPAQQSFTAGRRSQAPKNTSNGRPKNYPWTQTLDKQEANQNRKRKRSADQLSEDPSNERKEHLARVSRNFCDGCTEAARAAVGEDDFIRHFITALQAIKPSSLCFREKADWEEDLKPKFAPPDFNLDFLINPTPQNDTQQGIPLRVSDVLTPPPSKRLAYASSKSSKAKELQEADVMPRPFLTSSLIKTPRPDLSIGTKVDALLSALSSPNLSSIRAGKFLQQLQNQMIARAPAMILEPALISVPALRASDLAFPFAVLEGKAYSTGRQIFEAENQAAVSGACGLKIQICLDELVERAVQSSTRQLAATQSFFPLFFSICTEGLLYELWVHWTSVEDGVRKFNMSLLKLCHGVLLEGVVDFFIAVDNMLRWGTGRFVDSVVDRLEKVAAKAKIEV